MSQQDISGVLISGGSCSEDLLFIEDNGIPEESTNTQDFFTCDGVVPNTQLEAPGLSGTGSGLIDFDEVGISVELAGLEAFPESAFVNHSGFQLYLSDGELRILEKWYQSSDSAERIVRHKIDWGIYDGSIVLSLELGSAAMGEFEGGTFEFVGIDNPDDAIHAGINTIFYGTVFHDKDGSGAIDAMDEIMQVSEGNISVAGSKPNWSISIDLLLDNNQSLTGNYNGDFLDVPIADASVPQ